MSDDIETRLLALRVGTLSAAADAALVKYNPYHAQDGRFTGADGAHFVSTTNARTTERMRSGQMSGGAAPVEQKDPGDESLIPENYQRPSKTPHQEWVYERINERRNPKHSTPWTDQQIMEIFVTKDDTGVLNWVKDKVGGKAGDIAESIAAGYAKSPRYYKVTQKQQKTVAEAILEKFGTPEKAMGDLYGLPPRYFGGKG